MNPVFLSSRWVSYLYYTTYIALDVSPLNPNNKTPAEKFVAKAREWTVQFVAVVSNSRYLANYQTVVLNILSGPWPLQPA